MKKINIKKSHIKLYILEFILFFFLILNSFVSSILSRYNLIVCLILLLILFKRFFGFEKNRQRFVKDVLMEMSIFLLIFFIAYYLLGLIIGFYRAGNYFTFKGIKDYIFPIIVIIILKEFLRYNILTKSEGSKGLVVVTVLLFIFLDVTNYIYNRNYNSNYDLFLLLALYCLPAISSNIACSYITKKTGYVPVIVYQLIMNLYVYLLPILPNPSEYVYSVIMFVLPILLMYRIYSLFDKYKNEVVERDYYHKKSFVPFIPTIIIVMIFVYFVSGYFHFHAVAIGSGSMSPNISKGDVVIIEKIDGKYEKLENGQVIAYKHDGIVVVHRLINIVESNKKYYFYTKGDANEDDDNWIVNEEDVIGVVNVKIPYIGLPTVWINDL